MTKAPTVAETIAHRVRKYRNERGWSVRQLAEECAKRGATTLTQASLTNIERGLTSSSTRGSRAVSVEEMLTLAAVLDVPPIMMMIPFGEHNSVEVSPDVLMEPWAVANWYFGTRAARAQFGLPEPEDGYGNYERVANVVGYVRRVHEARQRAHDVYLFLDATEQQMRGLYRHHRDFLPLSKNQDMSEDEWIAAARTEMPQLYETRLRDYADFMWQAHTAGVRVPTVPSHLHDAIMALDPRWDPKLANEFDFADPAVAPFVARGPRPMLPPGIEVEDYEPPGLEVEDHDGDS